MVVLADWATPCIQFLPMPFFSGHKINVTESFSLGLLVRAFASLGRCFIIGVGIGRVATRADPHQAAKGE